MNLALNVPIIFWSGYGFQNLRGSVRRGLEHLHDTVIVWLVVIITVVTIVRVSLFGSRPSLQLRDSELLEKVWTIIPIFILVTIAIPSIHLLCVQDSLQQTPSQTVKVISNQWNWQREANALSDHLLDVDRVDNLGSYEVPMRVLSKGLTRILVVSTDVLHSLGVPRLRIKLDSIPGRLNGTTTDILYPGVMLGSCYELCGRGHRAIPIALLIS